MLKNYWRIAIRNLFRYKGYSLINILGLGLGLASCFIILLYVAFETSYENFHENRDDIYRVIPQRISNNVEQRQTWTPAGLAPLLEDQFREIERSCRFVDWGSGNSIKFGEKEMPDQNIVLADSTFFQMFSFKLKTGDPALVLKRPMNIVISQSIAETSFAGEDPVGKTIRFNNAFDFEITGVFEDTPQNSHLQFSYVTSFSSMRPLLSSFGAAREDLFTQLDSWNYSTYFYIPNSKEIEDLEIRASDYLDEARGREPNPNSQLIFQPLTEIHFTQGIRADTATGDITYVYGFSAVAIFILLIACLNFMNLATARAIRRSKEVGMRKVMGAGRRQLILQFLGESVLISQIAFLLSIIILEGVVPYLSEFLGVGFSINYVDNVGLILGMFFTGLVTGILAGSYPAFYLSSFRPSSALKPQSKDGGSSIIRKVLTVFQFAIASFLIVGTITAHRQLTFMKNSKLGFDKDQVVTFSLTGDVRRNFSQFKQSLLNQSEILSVTHANGIPGIMNSHYSYEFTNDGEPIRTNINTLLVDFDYFNTLGIEIEQGRSFSQDFPTDGNSGYIVNEKFVEEFGISDPIGMDFIVRGQERPRGKIVGVIQDFHYKGLQREVEPLACWIENPVNLWVAAVKINSTNISSTIAAIEEEWKKIEPERAFSYDFLDESFERLYKSEENVGFLMSAFSFLAIAIGSMGLLGLTAFIAEQRTKEIGIRKVLGASVKGIVYLLGKDFGLLILMGFALIAPFSYWLLNTWLQEFAYRIVLGLDTYIISVLVVFLLGLITVVYQSVKAAVVNPVESLRNVG